MMIQNVTPENNWLAHFLKQHYDDLSPTCTCTSNRKRPNKKLHGISITFIQFLHLEQKKKQTKHYKWTTPNDYLLLKVDRSLVSFCTFFEDSFSLIMFSATTLILSAVTLSLTSSTSFDASCVSGSVVGAVNDSCFSSKTEASPATGGEEGK